MSKWEVLSQALPMLPESAEMCSTLGSLVFKHFWGTQWQPYDTFQTAGHYVCWCKSVLTLSSGFSLSNIIGSLKERLVACRQSAASHSSAACPVSSHIQRYGTSTIGACAKMWV